MSGLYVHVPFCRAKCPYCDFYSSTRQQAVTPWLAALGAEMGLRGRQFPVVDTVYVGGGTPSLLSSRQLEQLMAAVRHVFVLTADVEVTIEVNPGDWSVARFQEARAFGFNRVSLGVQSFDDAVLQRLGRRHSARRARAAVAAARGAGFANLNIDLMYGVPGQSARSLEQCLHTACALEPSHISCYQLTVKPGTPFASDASWGQSDRRCAQQFEQCAEWLTAAGYHHYEVSNFCRSSASRCRHNDIYWQGGAYLGLGPAAHSFDGRQRRWWNAPDVAAYVRCLAAGHAPPGDSETLNDAQRTMELLLLGFRTDRGLPRAWLEGLPGGTAALRGLVSAGLVRACGARIVSTRAGMLKADGLARLFAQCAN